MEVKTLLRANLRRHRGGLAGIFALLFLASLLLCTVLTVWNNAGRYLDEELERAGYGTLTAWVSGAPSWDTLAGEIAALDPVKNVESQPILYANYELNGQESDSEGQMILYEPNTVRYRFFADDLSGYCTPPDAIPAGTVYASPAMISMFGAAVGDTITFPIARSGKTLTLTIAGWYEDPFMGSSMIGMKGFLISEKDRAAALAILQNAGIDALARDGAMLHIHAADAGLAAAALDAQINEATSLSAYAEFLHSRTAIRGFMLVLQNAFSGFLLAFAAVLLAASLAVLGHQIKSGLERDRINMGILKTLGASGNKLRTVQLALYLIPVAAGLLLGLLAAIPVSGMTSAAVLTTTGMLVPSALSMRLCLPVLGAVLALLAGFVLFCLRRLDSITPMAAIRSEAERPFFPKDRLPPVRGRALLPGLVIRQLLTGARWYAGACFVALLLTFFAAMVGRMDGWLGVDGKGMMDAFNPEDHDLGVQSFGTLTREEFEQTIRAHSAITDTYVLAMPGVSVNGVDMTANVTDQPERFHLLAGRAPQEADEIVLTEFVAADLGIVIGDTVTVGANMGAGSYTVSGIYSCANDMGQNAGMSREGYLRIGSDHPNLWCWHYFLADPSQKAAIAADLEARYGGDVHVHENTWPGLFGIIAAMRALVVLMYGTAALFILTVTAITGGRLLAAEQKDMGIYRSIGLTVGRLRLLFALRFALAAAVGAALGVAAAAVFTDPFVSAVMRLAGISNFASHPGLGAVLLPGAVITLLFFFFGWLGAGKIRRIPLTVLTAEQ